jgi:hypothetical protein
MPGNGILSGLALDAGGAPSEYGSNVENESPWAEALREAWQKKFAAGPNRQEPTVSNQTPSPFPNLPYATGALSWPRFVDSDFGMAGRYGASSSDTEWPPASAPAPTQRTGFIGYPNPHAFHSDAWPNANQPLRASADVIPASYQAGTRTWGYPIGPPDMLGPWRDQTQKGLMGLYDYLNSYRNTGAGVSDGDRSSPDCQKEWSDARDRCIDELTGPNPSRGVTGGYSPIEECARGLVSEECGGNYYDRPPEPRVKKYRLR